MEPLTIQGALADVLTERKRQDALWGEQNHEPRDYYLILAEEVGELAEAIAEDTVFSRRGTERVREEAVQVAAVALAMVEAIDRREKKTEALGQLEDYLTDRLQSPPDIKLRLPSSVVSGTEAGVALDRLVQAIAAAIKNEGPEPRFHRAVMARHRREWPTLWEAIDGVVNWIER